MYEPNPSPASLSNSRTSSQNCFTPSALTTDEIDLNGGVSPNFALKMDADLDSTFAAHDFSGKRDEKDLITTEFTPAQWNLSNMNNYKRADVIRQKSEAVRNLTSQLISEHEDYAKKGVEQAKYRLAERMRDVNFWREELKQEIRALREDTEVLVTSRRNLDHALAQTERPLRIYNKCKEFREKRLGIEMVKDSVEMSLLHEQETINQHQTILKDNLEECTVQIDRNQEMLNRLNSDLNAKEQANSINKTTMNLNLLTKGPMPVPKSLKKNGVKGGKKKEGDPNVLEIPAKRTKEWAQASQESIKISQNMRLDTNKMADFAENLCNQAVTEIKSAWESTNLALNNRIKELEDIQKRVQEHLDNTLKEMKDQDQHIENLKASINAKKAPLSLAKARIAMRSKLPEGEACYDTPYIALLEEIGQLEESMETLNRALETAQKTHMELFEVKQNLEHDIYLKSTSIQIDKTKCLPLRSEFPFHLWCGCNKCKSCRTSLYCRTHTCRKVT